MTLVAPRRRRGDRVLAIRRAIDAKPHGGVELFGSLTGAVPNDGLYHPLAAPAGFAPVQVDPTFIIVVRFLRAEWSFVDIVVPPPLTLQVMVRGQTSVALATLSQFMLLPTELGSPAIEQHITGIVQPGATITAAVKNTGTIAQQVNVYFTGWAYPQTLADGAGYERADHAGAL